MYIMSEYNMLLSDINLLVYVLHGGDWPKTVPQH